MRRNDKQITDQDILTHILKTNRICRIGLIDEERPYVISMNYRYKDNTIYLHSAPKGKKIDGLKTIMKQQTGKEAWDIPEAAVENIAVLEVVIEEITGKISGFNTHDSGV
ncbi:MAG: pyridoxamine 5'-phosphate oxidase family protein [Spirochaetaceae bacterium]